MCGRTVAEDRVKLQLDHRIPREWGGLTQEWNLQALCAECNQGKRDYFASFDPKLMTAVKNEPRVHVRLGETLRLAGGQGASADLLAFVADQREWDKRLRELREIGWDYRTEVRKNDQGRRETTYFLTRSTAWPADPAKSIRAAERAKRSAPARAHRPRDP